MSDPIAFPDVTARFGLPLLHVAQAQKELFVNEALARTDIILQPTVEGEVASPPPEPAVGTTYIVASPATGLFERHEASLASWQQGQWIFVKPSNGMRVFDRSISADRRYESGWSMPTSIAPPTGGNTIDSEARNAIATILECLRQSGTLPSS